MRLSTKELMAIAASDVFATSTTSCGGAVGRKARMRCLPQLTCVRSSGNVLFHKQKRFHMAINHSHQLENTAYQTPSVLPAAGSASGRLIAMPIEGLHLTLQSKTSAEWQWMKWAVLQARKSFRSRFSFLRAELSSVAWALVARYTPW
jgi:hypothetical protein